MFAPQMVLNAIAKYSDGDVMPLPLIHAASASAGLKYADIHPVSKIPKPKPRP